MMLKENHSQLCQTNTVKMWDCILCDSFDLKDLFHANIKGNTKAFELELSPVMMYSIILE